VGYAGRHPEAVRGVINFVGGLRGERCVLDANGRFFSDTARTPEVPMLWLYAEHDPYESASAIRGDRAAFEQAGGQGLFSLFPNIGGNGHDLANQPLFWRPALDAYLQELDRRTVPDGGGAKCWRTINSHAMFPGIRELSDDEPECKIVPIPL
jgi:dienelactone hydrolase